MPFRPIAPIVTALSTAVLLGTPVGPAMAVDETCQGRPATIVGTGPEVVGTAGDDVIVSGASAVIDAGAGNDLVCLSLPSVYSGPTGLKVDAGPGDDLVDASLLGKEIVRAYLDTGRDRYLGGPAVDIVDADGVNDEVSTGLGVDWVNLTVSDVATGVPGRYDAGPDEATRSRDKLTVHGAPFAIEVTLDSHLIVEDLGRADVTGFGSLDLQAHRAVVRGNANANNVDVAGCQIRVVGRGGNDYIDISYFRGADALQPRCEPDEQKTAAVSGGRGRDYISGSTGPDRLSGDVGNDRIQSRDGRDVVSGGAGRDELFGGGDRDVVRGNAGNDELHGGSGRDAADGGAGQDSCGAENERRCES